MSAVQDNSVKYSHVLRGENSELGYFVAKFEKSAADANDQEAVAELSNNIIPIIQESPKYQKLVRAWEQEKEDFLQKYQKLKELIPIEIKEILSEIRVDTKKDGFADPKVKRLIDQAYKALKDKSDNQLPPREAKAIMTIDALLSHLADLGARNIISKYGKVIDSTIYKKNAISGNCEHCSVLGITEFTYAHSFYELQEMEKVLICPPADAPLWVAWMYLSLVSTCWNTPASFFHDKELSALGKNQLGLYQYWAMIAGYWAEVSGIKNIKTDSQKKPFFNLSRIRGYLDVILAKIVKEQDNVPLVEKNTVVEVIRPYYVEIRLVEMHLLLDIQESIYSNPVTCVIHEFRSENNGLLFISNLFKTPGMTVLIPSSCRTGDSPAKYFTNMGLPVKGVLYKLFFKKGTEKNSAIMTRNNFYGGEICLGQRAFFEEEVAKLPKWE